MGSIQNTEKALELSSNVMQCVAASAKAIITAIFTAIIFFSSRVTDRQLGMKAMMPPSSFPVTQTKTPFALPVLC
ncbi:hypothetical protein CTA1_267 [Colletotrichum tanaceti]|uniref:Uncharacterized protein n=1 Tax=Colletotrichum tanaceti TaxID=1306861 RepID=A0A4U6XAM6_9PEZI|nr:hypothetical protein CTA1_267 [Colletotrichum tanaceti]